MENYRSRSCVWLVNTLLSYGRLSLVELAHLWDASIDLSALGPLSRIKLQRAISAALDMLGVVIECDRRDGYRYYIAANSSLKSAEWLISSQAINQGIKESEHVRDRILLEEIPSGQYHLSTIVDAMSNGKALEMSYRKFADSETVTSFVEPYCVKLSQQRWYLLGRKDHRDHLQLFALDRISQLRVLYDQCFTPPSDFSAHEYFAHYFGVHTGGGIPASDIRIRADKFWTNYLLTLPLHSSQYVIESRAEATVFGYQMAATPDLLNHLLSLGPGIEVLQPLSLREQMHDNVRRMYQLYEHKA